MSKLMIALFVAAGLGFAGAGSAQMYSPKTPSAPMSKDSYTTAKTDADAQYKIDKNACSALSGNAKDICTAEAKGKDDIAKAEAAAAARASALLSTREDFDAAVVDAMGLVAEAAEFDRIVLVGAVAGFCITSTTRSASAIAST